MKNEKEEPIKVKCTQYNDDQSISICEIDEKINLKDNEDYNIYYSTNIYNLFEDIIEDPIGEFKYINTNYLERLYYKINDLDLKNGTISLTTTNILKKDEILTGILGPDYENVAECYQYKFFCKGNGSYFVDCAINVYEEDKLMFNGKYIIYSLEGYSLNEIEINKKLNLLKNKRNVNIEKKFIIVIIFIIISLLYIKKLRVKFFPK